MAARVKCPDCGAPVPWFFEEFGMHPDCHQRRSDEEGCGAVFAEIQKQTFMEVEGRDNGR